MKDQIQEIQERYKDAVAFGRIEKMEGIKKMIHQRLKRLFCKHDWQVSTTKKHFPKFMHTEDVLVWVCQKCFKMKER